MNFDFDIPGCHFLSASVAQPGSFEGGSRLNCDVNSEERTEALADRTRAVAPRRAWTLKEFISRFLEIVSDKKNDCMCLVCCMLYVV